MKEFLASTSRPPAPQAGGPLPLTPFPLVPVVQRFMRTLRPRLVRPRLTTILYAIIGLLVVAIIILSTCLAYGQDVRSSNPPGRRDAQHGSGPTPAFTAPSSPTGPTATMTRRGGAAPAARLPHPAPGETHSRVWLCLAALAGGVVGRKTARRVRKSIEPSTAIVPVKSAPVARSLHHLGAVSITGPVRESNQDRAAVARIGDCDVMLIADGLGGLPRGGEAAELVVTYALEQLRAELPSTATCEAGVRALLLRIVWGAALVLARAGATVVTPSADPGLRTTLIIVVASAKHYVCAWIGDGGVFIARADSSLVELVEPHKDPSVPDVLHASLGPTTEGRPSWAITARSPGDVLVGATDGIADAFGETYVRQIRDALRVSGGDAPGAARIIVDALAAERDGGGQPIHSDNLTLALLTTERPS